MTLQWCKSNIHVVETVLWILTFSLAGHIWYHTPVMLGSSSEPFLLGSHLITKINIWYLEPFCFSLSVQYSIYYMRYSISSVQSLSRVQLVVTPMNRSTPGLPVHHQLLKFTQTHVHQVSDAIQPSHPLLSPSPPAPNPSQNQSLFQWVNSSHEAAKVLEFQL